MCRTRTFHCEDGLLSGQHHGGLSVRAPSGVQAESRIEEALALWLDREPDTFTITPEYPKELSLLASQVSKARATAEQAGTKAQEATIEAAHRLTELGLSRRDAADLLGISHQRVQQLLEAS